MSKNESVTAGERMVRVATPRTASHSCLRDQPTPRVLCWIMCDEKNLHKVRYVKESWIRHCDQTLFMSSVTNSSFPTVGLNVSAGREHIASKAKAAWQYIYENYGSQFHYFLKADPDTYVVVHHMKGYLRGRNASHAEYFGHCFMLNGHKNDTYFSGGSGASYISRGQKILHDHINSFEFYCVCYIPKIIHVCHEHGSKI